MAHVVVPNFANIVLNTSVDQTGMSPGTVIAGAIGSSIGRLTNSLVENDLTRQSLLGFADAQSQANPALAGTFKAMASSIPLLSVDGQSTVSGPGQSGTRLGGGGGVLSNAMKDMMDMAKFSMQNSFEIGQQNNRLSNALTLNDAQLTSKIIGTATSFKSQSELIKEREAAKEEGMRLQNEMKTPERDAKLEDNRLKQEQIDLRQRQLEQQNDKTLTDAYQHAATGYEKLDGSSGTTKKIGAGAVEAFISTDPKFKPLYDPLQKIVEDPDSDPNAVRAASAQLKRLRLQAVSAMGDKIPAETLRAKTSQTLSERLGLPGVTPAPGSSSLDTSTPLSGLLPSLTNPLPQ